MKILKLYNEDYTSSWFINDYKNCYIEEELETGIKRLHFQIPVSSPVSLIIQEEMYLYTEDYCYIVKEVNKNNNNYYDIYCDGNIEELYGTSIDSFDVIFAPLDTCLSTAMADTNWSYEIKDEIVGTYTTTERYKSVKEILDLIKIYFNIEYEYDTKNKKLIVYNTRGSNKGDYLFSDLDLQDLKIQSNTYDFSTKIIPIGKNDINIALVNDDKMFLENYSYSNKKITTYWINDDCDTPELLLAAAKKRIIEVSIPARSYLIKTSKLQSSIEVGDIIIIIDNNKKIKDTQRVKKKTIYPDMPELDSIEVSNKIVTFDILQANKNREFLAEINKLKRK